MQIAIEKNESDEFVGKVIALNDHKLVQMFVEHNDIWITGIQRKSNFEFILSEKRIASALFSQYGQDTKDQYRVQFMDNNTFGLEKGNADPTKSSVVYRRIK
jgi:hypothetical protein